MQSGITVESHTQHFQNGLIEGLSGAIPENCLWNLACPATEDDIVAVVTNLTELATEGGLSEEQVRHDAGLLTGWIIRSTRQTRGE